MVEIRTATAGYFPAVPAAVDDSPVKIQQRLGFDFVVGHHTSWKDGIFGTLSSHENVHSESLPYPDGCLKITGELTANQLLYDETDLDSTNRLLVVPDPYTLNCHASGTYFETELECLAAITDYLYQEISLAPPHAIVCILAPGIVHAPPPDGMDARCSAAIDRLCAASEAPVILAGFGDGYTEKVHAHLLDADITAMGYDLVRASEHSRELILEYGSTDQIALGLLDTGTGVGIGTERLEATIADFVTGFGVQTFSNVYAMPAGPLSALPWNALEPLLLPLAELNEQIN